MRNGASAQKVDIFVPYSRMKADVTRILKEEGYITDYEVDTKGGGTRFVPLNERAMSILGTVPDYGTEFVFNITNFAKHWRRALKLAGLKDFR